jgi:hypothetical protein
VDASPEAKAVKKLPIDQVSKVPLEAPSDVHELDLSEGLKQLLEDKKCDLNYLLQVEPAKLARQLGIDEDIAKLIIKAAKDANSK